MTGHLIVTDEDAIRVITLRRPGKKNAITQDMYRGMSEAIDGARWDEAAAAVPVTAAVLGRLCDAINESAALLGAGG